MKVQRPDNQKQSFEANKMLVPARKVIDEGGKEPESYTYCVYRIDQFVLLDCFINCDHNIFIQTNTTVIDLKK